MDTLSSIVEQVNDARLFDKPLPVSRRKQLAAILASRQGLPGSYAGLFAPVDGELINGYRFYTGERITTNAGCRHILGEESLRALALLRPTASDAPARDALARAAESVDRMLHTSETEHHRPRGTYCCMRCSIALWRALSTGIIDQSAARLCSGIKLLRARRDSQGQWAGYPFHYTLSALLEATSAGNDAADVALAELRYARPLIERRLARKSPAGDRHDAHALRRRALLEQAMQSAA